MKKIKWTMSAMAAAVLSLGLAAQAAQPQPQPAPKTPRAQTYTYWVGDPSGTKGSYLGVDVADVSKDRVSALKLKDEHGVEVTMVDQDAPAGKAGLKEHDVILEYNGARVEGEEELKRMIHETPAGRKVMLGISRDGQTMQIPVTLGERNKTMTWSSGPVLAPHAMTVPMPPMPEIDIPDMNNFLPRSYSQAAGMMVDNLTPQLGEYFGVKSGSGVLVRSVDKGSAAEAAGVKAGDVVVKIGEERVADRNDFRRAIRDRKSAKVPLGIVRDRKEQTVTITLSAPRKESSRLRGRILRDRDGDVIEDDDDDIDIDIDMDMDDWNGAAALVSQKAQELAFSQANKSLIEAQRTINKRWSDIQPRVEQEMKKAQERIQEEMKRMEQQLRELQDRQY